VTGPALDLTAPVSHSRPLPRRASPGAHAWAPWKTAAALILCAVQLVPIYVTTMVALKPQTDLSSTWEPPAHLALGNFTRAIEQGGLLRALLNTVFITACSTALVVAIGAMAAYPLARSRSRLNGAVATFILSILMIPALSLLVPLYVLVVRAHAISTFWGIVPIHVTFNLPLSIFMFTNFIRTIPRELEEAALLDGCSVYSIFLRIVLPLLKPVTVSVVLLTAAQVWNDFQYSIYFLQKPTMRVLTLSIASFFGISGSDPHVAAAGALLAILPMAVLFLFLQKYFVRGMVESAFK
jgi:raffinose/stachyose/melibiose transport system permease protein